jgi:hypothetical protein
VCACTYLRLLYVISTHTGHCSGHVKFFVRRRTLQSRSILFFHHLSVSRSRIKHCACRTWIHSTVRWSSTPARFTFRPSSFRRSGPAQFVAKCIAANEKSNSWHFLFVDWLQQERNAWRASRALVRIEKDYTVLPTYVRTTREKERILIRKKLSVISFSLFAWVCHRLIQCRRPHTHT